MADISAIKALDGVTYSIKDSEARNHLVPSTGTTGQILTKTASGYGWADASGGGTVDTVNGISPDSNKNVQVDVELTQAQYDALPASKLTDDVNYFIKDGAYRPQGSVIDAEGVMYDNTDSGLTSDTVQGAIDENASAIEELSAGLSTTNGNLSSLTNTVWEWETFQGTVGGVAQTFYRKRLGNVYIMFGAGSVNVAIGAGATSQRQIVYANKPFNAVYGGAANLAVTGQIDSYARYVNVGRDRVDAWLYNSATTTVSTMFYNFIVIGTAS